MAIRKSSVPARNKRAPRTNPTSPRVETSVLSRNLGTDWLGFASPVNSALAEAVTSEREDVNSDMSDLISEMSFSPMFRLLIQCWKADMATPDGEEEDWYTTLLASRVYVAGKIAAHREASQAVRNA